MYMHRQFHAKIWLVVVLQERCVFDMIFNLYIVVNMQLVTCVMTVETNSTLTQTFN